MDTINKIISIPSWAYDFCYYYLAVAVIVVAYSLWALIKLFTLPGIVKKFVPVTMMALALILSGVVTTVLTMMQFWICRSALAPPAAKVTIKVKEDFAVKCNTDGDCTAVMGTPQGSECSCGARGFCGGCKMRNNMEPQPSFNAVFDGDFSPMGFGDKPYY
jgi:hypothetical protein